jgi:hypothetical protein
LMETCDMALKKAYWLLNNFVVECSSNSYEEVMNPKSQDS